MIYFVSFLTAVISNLSPKLSHISPVTVSPRPQKSMQKEKGKGVFLPDAEEEPTI